MRPSTQAARCQCRKAVCKWKNIYVQWHWQLSLNLTLQPNFYSETFLTHTLAATVHKNGRQSLIYSSSYAHNTHKCMEGIFNSLTSLHDGSKRTRDWSKENELKQNKNLCIRDLVKSAYSTHTLYINVQRYLQAFWDTFKS